MELQMKGRKKYNFSILPEKDVTSVYKLSGGNNRKVGPITFVLV